MNSHHNKIFSKICISKIFDATVNNVENEIAAFDIAYLLKLNSEEYVDSLRSKHLLIPPKIEFENAYSQSYEKDFPATYFPQSFKIPDYKSQKTAFIQHFIPVNDPNSLLSYRPVAQKATADLNFFISANAISKEYIDDKKTRKQFKADATQIQIVLKALINEINAFNKAFKQQCLEKLERRKNEMINR